MKYTEFKRHIGKAGLTIKEFASLVKMTPTAVSNFKLKEHVPKNMAIIVALMGELAENGLDFRQVISKLDIEAITPRDAYFGKKNNPQ